MAANPNKMEENTQMSIQNAIVKTGATGMTVVGGADMSFSPDGVSIPNGVHLAIAADADFRTRRNMTVKSKQPVLLPSGVYSKGKQSITVTCPKILADGSTTFNLIRIEREVHPESTAAEAFELNMVGAQALSDADFTAFWAGGSLA